MDGKIISLDDVKAEVARAIGHYMLAGLSIEEASTGAAAQIMRVFTASIIERDEEIASLSEMVTSADEKLAEYEQVMEWRPISEAPTNTPCHIIVRSEATYRWLPYKPDGKRQMNVGGRWQVLANEYGGWEKASLPDGSEFRFPEPPRNEKAR